MNTIRYSHFKKFVHGNLTPSNIFYDGKFILITGWEWVGNLLKDKHLKNSTLPKYLKAPEV